jgi:hypothetical protein
MGAGEEGEGDGDCDEDAEGVGASFDTVTETVADSQVLLPVSCAHS